MEKKTFVKGELWSILTLSNFFLYIWSAVSTDKNQVNIHILLTSMGQVLNLSSQGCKEAKSRFRTCPIEVNRAWFL